MSIQNRRGKDADFDANKMLPGELAVTTDGTRKVYAAFAPGDVREFAFKDQIPIVGDVTPDKLQEAVNNYLNENPVHAGATEEEAKQIELNRKNIEANDEAIQKVGEEVEKTNTNVAQLSNPNLFINGNFQIWNRGESFTVKINDDGTYGGYVCTADKWIVGAWSSNTAYVYRTDKGLTFAREQAEPIDVFQVLEEETLKSILGKTLTMSYAIEDATGAYQEYTRKIVLDENIEIEPFAIAQEYFCIELQMGCTLIWAKLEVGEATPFVPRLYAEDLMLCQRYYYEYKLVDAIAYSGRSGTLYIVIPQLLNMHKDKTIIPTFGGVTVSANGTYTTREIEEIRLYGDCEVIINTNNTVVSQPVCVEIPAGYPIIIDAESLGVG